MIYDVTGLEPEQRHTGHAKSRDCNLSRLVRAYRIVVVIEEFRYEEFRLEMSTIEVLTVREGVLHFCGRISRI